MNIFVLLYNSGTDKEGIHSIELKGRTIVLMFEDKDDAIRYCGLLEAQDFPLPTVEMINIDEIRDFLHFKMYNNKKVLLKNNEGKKIIKKLFNEISKKPKKFLTYLPLKHNKYRSIADYISGMTDRFAINIYKSIK